MVVSDVGEQTPEMQDVSLTPLATIDHKKYIEIGTGLVRPDGTDTFSSQSVNTSWHRLIDFAWVGLRAVALGGVEKLPLSTRKNYMPSYEIEFEEHPDAKAGDWHPDKRNEFDRLILQSLARQMQGIHQRLAGIKPLASERKDSIIKRAAGSNVTEMTFHFWGLLLDNTFDQDWRTTQYPV